MPKFWQAKLLIETDGETIDVTMDSYHDIEMRNELHVDEVWYVYHHGWRVGMMTSNSLLESTTSDSVQRRRFVHPCQSWPAVYRLMRRAHFILHISENRSAAISMWFKSNTQIQPTPLLCPRFQLNCCFVSNAVLTWPFGLLINIRIPMWSQLWVNFDLIKRDRRF